MVIILRQGNYYFDNKKYFQDNLNGVKHGKSAYFSNDNHPKLVGYFENDKYVGLDKYKYENGDYYIGKLINGFLSSKGKIFNKDNNLKYEGDLVNGIPEGKGMSFFENGNIYYIGDFIKGKPEGKGKKIIIIIN